MALWNLQIQVLPQAYRDNQARMDIALPRVALKEAKAIMKTWEANPASNGFPDPVGLATIDVVVTSLLVALVSLLTGLDTWQFWDLPGGGMTSVRHPQEPELS